MLHENAVIRKGDMRLTKTIDVPDEKKGHPIDWAAVPWRLVSVTEGIGSKVKDAPVAPYYRKR